MALEKLTAAFVLKVQRDPQAHIGKHADGGGLYLQVADSGSIYWRYKYRIGGKENVFAIGLLQDNSLAEAREKHQAARKLVDQGKHPIGEKRRERAELEVARAAARPFRDVGQEWFEQMIEPHLGDNAISRYKCCMGHLNDGFGDKPLGEIGTRDLTAVLVPFEKAGKFSVRERAQHTAVRIMGFAVGRGYADINPFVGIKYTASYTSPEAVRESRPALTDPADFGRLLRDIERAVRLDRHALRLLALTFVRPKELIQQRWSNIRWADAKMVVPFEAQKMRTHRKKAKSDRVGCDFEVPLSRQAIAELRELEKLTGGTPYLFPAQSASNKGTTLDVEAPNKALVALDYQGLHCAHGFRSSASTMLNRERIVIKTVDGEEIETVRWPDQKALIEVQLDHDDASTQAIYDRGGRWSERKQIMQLWADRVDEMRNENTRLALAA